MSGIESAEAAPKNGDPLSKKKNVRNKTEEETLETLFSDGEEKKVDWGENVKFLYSYMAPIDVVYLIASVMSNIIYGAINPLFLIIFGSLIDQMYSNLVDIDYYTMLMAYLALVSFIVNWIGGTTTELFSFRISSQMKTEFFKASLSQEMGWYDKFDSGLLTTRLEASIVQVRNAIGLKLGQVIMLSTMGIGGLVVAFIKDWELSLVTLAALPAVGLTVYLFTHWSTHGQDKTSKAYEKAGSVAEEAFIGIRTVTSLSSQSRFQAWFRRYIVLSENVGIKMSVYAAIMICLMSLVINLTVSLSFWYSGRIIGKSEIVDGDLPSNTLPSGDAIIVLFGVITAAFAGGQSASNAGLVVKGFASMASLQKIITRKSAIDPYDESGTKNVTIKGDIRFENVDFRFPTLSEKLLFKNLSFSINAGEVVAIVGESGVGKSSVLQLLQRFYDPEGGRITIDGLPLKEYNINWLRKQFGVVTQQPRLFSMSIAENIRLGAHNSNATMDQVMGASRLASADKFVSSLPDGYDTFVGEGGSLLSGGQKQRLVIARALIRTPKFLLLDEATASLDVKAERAVQQAIDSVVAAKMQTTIIVAHRLSTIINSDKIIVLKNPNGEGVEVAEIGTHTELMQIPDGVYNRLMRGQMEDKPIVEPLAATLDVSPADMQQPLHVLDEEQEDLDSFVPEPEQPPTEEPFYKRWFKKKATVPGEFPEVSNVTMMEFLEKSDLVCLSLGLLGAVLEGFSFPAMGIFFSHFIESLSLPRDVVISEVESWTLYFTIFSLVVFVITAVEMVLIEAVGFRLVTTLRTKLFDSLLKQEIGYFDNPNNSPGALTGILAGDVMLVKGGATGNIGIAIKSSFSVVGGIIIAFLGNWKLALVAIAATMILIPANILEQSFLVDEKAMDRVADKNKKGQGTQSIMSEGMLNVRSVASLGIETILVERYRGIMDSVRNKKIKDAIMFGLGWGFSQGGTFAVNAVLFYYGSILMKDGELTTLSFNQTLFAMIFASMGVAQVGIYLTDAKKAQSARDRIYALIHRPSALDPTSNAGKDCDFSQASAKDVTFYYESRPDYTVLNKVNVEVGKGKVVAIVGESGCGKSTIIQLIERFYDIPEPMTVVDVTGNATQQSRKTANGQVLLDHDNTKDLNLRSLRQKLGLVSQEPILFNTTIEENIALGVETATKEEVVKAAQLAGVHNFIMSLPRGYSTIVGRLGEKLSGGQRQRVAIARAVMQAPKLLLLDEATSALDSESEKVVQEALSSLLQREGTTAIIVAHRLSTIRDADKIVVLKAAGKDATSGSYVTEEGTHDELLKRNGEYYKLFSLNQ